MDSSLPGSSIHGIFQARILEWVAISFPRGFSQPRDQTYVSRVSCIAGGFFTVWTTREAQCLSPSACLSLHRTLLQQFLRHLLWENMSLFPGLLQYLLSCLSAPYFVPYTPGDYYCNHFLQDETYWYLCSIKWYGSNNQVWGKVKLTAGGKDEANIHNLPPPLSSHLL